MSARRPTLAEMGRGRGQARLQPERPPAVPAWNDTAGPNFLTGLPAEDGEVVLDSRAESPVDWPHAWRTPELRSGRTMAAQMVATVASLYRFPVKSMAGEEIEQAKLYWHGIEGDRRQVFVKTRDLSSFPWLTARDVPELVLHS